MLLIHGEIRQEPYSLGPSQTAYFLINVESNRKTFTIIDTNTTTEDLALSVWFSYKPFENNIRWKNYLNRQYVQQKKPLVVSIIYDHLNDEISEELDALSIETPNGAYYLNVQNMSGTTKSFQISEVGGS